MTGAANSSQSGKNTEVAARPATVDGSNPSFTDGLLSIDWKYVLLSEWRPDRYELIFMKHASTNTLLQLCLCVKGYGARYPPTMYFYSTSTDGQ